MARGNGRAALRPLLAKLAAFIALSDRDIQAIEAAIGREERIAAHQNLAGEREPPPTVFVILRGMACRFRNLSDGRRQILSFMIPRDFFDLHSYALHTVSYSITMLAPTTIASLDRVAVNQLITYFPRVFGALRWYSQQEEAILHERIVRLGRGNAHRRVASHLCEMICRQRAVGLSEDHTIWLPVTQTDLIPNPDEAEPRG